MLLRAAFFPMYLEKLQQYLKTKWNRYCSLMIALQLKAQTNFFIIYFLNMSFWSAYSADALNSRLIYTYPFLCVTIKMYVSNKSHISQLFIQYCIILLLYLSFPKLSFLPGCSLIWKTYTFLQLNILFRLTENKNYANHINSAFSVSTTWLLVLPFNLC